MGFLKATPNGESPMGHTDDSRPSASTFANVTVQTDECMSQPTPEILELQQTIGCHFWLANLELSAGTPPSVKLKVQPET